MTNHVFLGLPDRVQSSDLRSRRSYLDDAPWLDWVMRAQSGDETAWEQIFDAVKPLLRLLLRTYYGPSWVQDRDDLWQIARIGVWQAVMQYEPERHVPLEAWLRFVIRRRLDDMVRQAYRQKRSMDGRLLRWDAPDWTEDRRHPVGFAGNAADLDPLQVLERHQMRTDLYAALHDLTLLEWRVVWDIAAGYSYEDVARRWGRSRKTVDNALQRARRKLREKGMTAR
ncbi:sigma-70 family RNA polymerase sigma factor [Sulfobacillus thermosulfidooxidans]|uniref:sigma-70 family RNA polymerase sigma factor n=1 Tax=Sulfobacillus thermosulfidooxidans TaxID=28034 RepID=UPI0006B63ED7|nr:sigma-70 family RNA polymerase sigma factor [Sulfobacillus thermosulfidooxidans]